MSSMIGRKALAGGVAVAVLGFVSAYALAQQPAPKAAPKAAAAATGGAHPGEAIFHTWCGACHDNGGVSGAPATESMRGLSRANVRYTLEYGYMKQQARAVPPADLQKIIDWLPIEGESNDAWLEKAKCTAARRNVDLSAKATRASKRH